jgi:hypothetical protein
MVSHLKSQTLDESVGILPGVDGLQRTRQDISCSWPVDREAMDGHPDGEEEALVETGCPGSSSLWPTVKPGLAHFREKTIGHCF